MGTVQPCPIEAFAFWYGALPIHVQLHLALIVTTAEGIDLVVPDGTPLEENPIRPQGFIARLRRPYARRLEVLARIAVIKTVMEICLAMPKSDVETWAEKRAALITFMVSEGSKGDKKMEGLFRELLDRVPEEEDYWADIWISWKDLTETPGPLSDSSLRKWLEEGYTGDLTLPD